MLEAVFSLPRRGRQAGMPWRLPMADIDLGRRYYTEANIYRVPARTPTPPATAAETAS